MIHTRRRFGRTLAAAAAVSAAWPLGVAAQAPRVIKFSHVVAEKTPKGQAALKFKELVEKTFPGRVQVQVFPSSQLFGDAKELEAVLLGDVHLIAPSLSKFDRYTKKIQVFDLPFLFDDMAAVDRFQSSPHGRALLESMTGRGLRGLAYWHNGMKQLSDNRERLLRPEDVKGLKFRIQASDVLEAQFRALGANPQKLAFAEVYQALQTGVVDGCENTPSNYLTQKFYEVQKDITVSYHAHLQYAVIVNTKFWNGLPPDIRKELDKAMAEATDYTNSIAASENKDALEAIKKSGKTTLHYLTDAQKAEWQKAMRPTYTWAKGRVGQEVLDLIAKELHVQM
ncbi:MAG: TRAP transporter substrate-binding protein [Burkholderiales bacterium]|nr:TRAP transporter substrate-binding protein [Burkholderiales bacterium]